MPHIEASFFAKRFEDATFSEQMIAALTQAVSSVIGEAAGKDTTVVLHGIDPSRWGHRGKPLAGALTGLREERGPHSEPAERRIK